MAAKRPTGERPKQLSKQAKKYADNPVYLTGSKYNKLVPPSEAAAAAGKKRDFEKSFGATVDTRKPKKVPTKKPSTIQQVAKRFNITAREARDIATAVGTSMQGRKSQAGGTKDMARENLIRQIKEVGTAAKSGKKGSTSDKFIPEYSSYYPGSKRKKLG